MKAMQHSDSRRESYADHPEKSGTGHFRFSPRDTDGGAGESRVTARNRYRADAISSQRGVFMGRLSQTRGDDAHANPRAKRSQLVNQMWQLATMIEAGIGLSESLDCLARQGSDPRLRALLRDISGQVQEGRALSDAMSRHPHSFPASLVAMIRASEHSGSLAKVLRQSSIYLDKDRRIVDRMRAALMYPAILLTVASGVFIFLLTFVLPKFSAIYAARGVQLPAPTRVILALSQSVVGAWHFWFMGMVVAFGLAWTWARTSRGRTWIDHAIVTVPIVSRLANSMFQSRAFRALAMLVDARVSLVDALAIIRNIVPNRVYRELWEELEEQVRVGEHLAVPLMRSPVIDESIAQMIDKGDRSGRLGVSLNRVADFLEERYDRSVSSTVQIMEPALLMAIGGTIGLVVISMMLPLFQSASVVAG